MKPERTPWSGGFTLIELLVAAALAGVLITMVVMSYQALVANGGTRTSYGTITVGSALTNFYGGTNTVTNAYFAPNYGRAAQAEVLRQQFVDDIQSASAVFCLGRNAVNTTHPTTITVPGTFRGDSYDTPQAFQQFLTNAIPSAASTFTVDTLYRGASTATNASIFILKPSPSTNALTLSVQAVYDIDLTPATFNDPDAAGGAGTGVYASVKRYQPGQDILYYDVFYPNNAKTPALNGTIAFNPLVVCFERAVRSIPPESVAIDAFKVAAARPFYFVWWPDPTAHTLKAFSAPTYAADNPQAYYAAMGGRTAFFLVVPMFPGL